MFNFFSKRPRSKTGCWAVIHCTVTDNFLFGRRSPWLKNGGCWNLFGGRADAEEAPLQTLVRELNEELGIAFPEDRFIKLGYRKTINQQTGKTERRMHFYLIQTTEEFSPRLNLEHSEARWFALDNLPKVFNRPSCLAIDDGLLEKARTIAPPSSMIND